MDNHKQHKEDFCAVWSQSDCKLSVYILGDCKEWRKKNKTVQNREEAHRVNAQKGINGDFKNGRKNIKR